MQNMGIRILPILRTDTQRELLIELFFLTDRPRTLSNLATAIGVDQTTVMREVNRLLESGVVVEERVGRARTVEINESSPFTGPLRQLMRVVYQPIGELSDGAHIVPGGRHGSSRAAGGRHERRPLPSSRRRP
ncbi:MAG: winged helix-turn-helix transcriptional regulator [Acidimicrobiia bacterium]|nr:winged helix-turn-helix transcriptional regulator [Acidimicrobiia bacterium]